MSTAAIDNGNGPVCAMPENVSYPASLSSSVLRAAGLTNANGQRIVLGDAIGRGTSIVIFLRHLACPYCWSYAKEWSELQNEVTDSNIAGPFFISIGDEKKLAKFLELNPYMSRDRVFVDGYDFDAYKSVGFGRFDETDKETASKVKLAAPSLSGEIKGWWDYLSNFNALSPIPKEGIKFGEIPEGVLRLGGTFVVNGDEIVYRWSDRLPGDHPDVAEVLRIAQEASSKKPKKLGFEDFLAPVKGMFSIA